MKTPVRYSILGDTPPNKNNREWDWYFKDYPVPNGLKVFSCFACGGGSTMGYKLAGCEVIGCCEIDPKMNEVYVANHHPKYNFPVDIREFNNTPNSELPEELFDLDILDGSPPCTTFTTLGKREETWGKKKKFREGQKEQTLDDLLFVFIETAKKLQPKVVVMENVEGLLLGNAQAYVQKIYEEMDIAGYQVKHYLLKAEEMGVPQTRHRVFFIGVRKDIPFDFFNLNMQFDYPSVPYREIKQGEGEKPNDGTVRHRLVSNILPGDKDLGKVRQRLYGDPYFFGEKVCSENEVLPTIATHGYFYREKERTFLSIKDIVHASTFPNDYSFIPRTYRDVCYICGMSVPPLMIKRVTERIIETGIFEKEIK